MDGGAASQPIHTLNEKVHKAFNSIDTDKDGFISLEDLTQYFSTGVPPGLADAFASADTEGTGKIAASQFKTVLLTLLETISALGQGQTVEQFRANFNVLKEQTETTESAHLFDLKVGDISQLNTKLEAKFLMNDADEEKHFQHITKGLKYHEQTVGIIFRLQAHEPHKVEEKLKELIEQAQLLVQSMFPPSSIPAQIFNALEFETAHDEERITVAIKVSDECDNLYLLGYLAFLDKYYSVVAGSTTIVAGFKNDFHSFIGQNVDLLKVLAEGFTFGIHSKTNCAAAGRKILDTPIYSLFPGGQQIAAFGKIYLQKGFKFELAFDSIEFADILGKSYSPISPSQAPIVSRVNDTVSTVRAVTQQLPIPVIAELFEFLFTHIKTNFSFSFTFPKFVSTIHFKTSGVKELVQSFSDQASLAQE